MLVIIFKFVVRIVLFVLIRLIEEKNLFNFLIDIGLDKMYLNLNNNILSYVIFFKLK